MRIGSLFSGIGGLDLAVAAVLGGEVAWHVENDPDACRVLAHRFSGVSNLGDITAVDWPSVEPVDVLCGGFPCQDVSSAGKRAGLDSGTRSGLWSEFARAIAVLRPDLVVIENVRGLLSARAGRGPDAADIPDDWTEHTYAVPTDEAEADADRDLGPDDEDMGDDGSGPVLLRALGAVLGDLADLGFDARWCGLRAADVGAPHGRFRVFVVAEPAADTDGWGWQEQPECHSHPVSDPAYGYSPWRDPARRDHAAVNWGKYTPAIRRWERLTRPAPMPWVVGPKGGRQLNPAFSEWMMGYPAGWVTDVPGVGRNAALRLLGNAVVPAQAEAALRSLLYGRSLGWSRPPSGYGILTPC